MMQHSINAIAEKVIGLSGCRWGRTWDHPPEVSIWTKVINLSPWSDSASSGTEFIDTKDTKDTEIYTVML